MIKKGIKVKILSGKDKKKEGEVIEIDRANNRAKVKGINIVKKHIKTKAKLLLPKGYKPNTAIIRYTITSKNSISAISSA